MLATTSATDSWSGESGGRRSESSCADPRVMSTSPSADLDMLPAIVRWGASGSVAVRWIQTAPERRSEAVVGSARAESQYPYLPLELGALGALGAGAATDGLAAGAAGADPPTVAIEKPSTPLPVVSPAFVSPCQ